MTNRVASFRVGKVRAYLRGRIWYLCYFEHGRRRRPRVGTDRAAAKRLAAQVNAQLEAGDPAVLSFEPIQMPELRARWLAHHEHVLRSSVQTVARYRTATDHLLRFLDGRALRSAAHFRADDAEAFAQHLREIEVSPNGHKNSAKRPLMDKGLVYVLECCRALFGYATRLRHLPPYAENPFVALRLDRIPLAAGRPMRLFEAGEERAFYQACDSWQLPLFLTLALTGVRPGELTHLLLPDDVDLEGRLLRVRNKPALGWQVKTRAERDVPLLPELAELLRRVFGGRRAGPAFRVRRLGHGPAPGPKFASSAGAMQAELARREERRVAAQGRPLTRAERAALARGLWRAAGAVREDRVRLEFMRLTRVIGLPAFTAPKVLRHQFATALQEAGVDPLVRNELMGHVAAGAKTAGHGLGMTAVYTHTRPETRRRQLEAALAGRPATVAAMARLVDWASV